jgi:flavin-dependent thymidylate synthase
MPQGASGPRVYLLNATPDPLGSLAALVATYEGRIVRSLDEVTDDQRRAAYAAMEATALNSALECMQFHFLIEGVDRDFTHQHVRGRHAFYAQESLRFAVKEDWANEVPLPPSLAQDPDSPQARIWQRTLVQIEDSYAALVQNGMPAEEARGLLPGAVRTRIHWVVTWRELLHVAGLRTCTQAQFIWRIVMGEVVKALRQYGLIRTLDSRVDDGRAADGWQFKFLAGKLRPVCYQTGRCQFRADFDRSCTIRDRVEANYRIGRDSSRWHEGFGEEWDSVRQTTTPAIPAIQDWEWAADPAAARKVGGDA